jgi:hypothetical protein
MERLEIALQRFEETKICAPLRIGFSKIFPDIKISVGEQEIESHPRIRRCIDLMNTGIDNLPFHGYDSLESINKIFCEHFLNADNIHSRRCREQLIGIKETGQLYAGIGTPGRLLDDYQLGGSHTIRAACLARTKTIDEGEIDGGIREAVKNFVQIKDVQEYAEIVEEKNGKVVVRRGGIPSYYHLQILAYSRSWRVGNNQAQVCEGIRRVFQLDIPAYYLRHKSQIVAPARLNFYRLNNLKTEYDILWWFDVVKLLLMAGYNDNGFISSIRAILRSFELRQISKSFHFMKWGAYSGLALEPNWRSGIRKAYDIYYRVQEIECLVRQAASQL